MVNESIQRGPPTLAVLVLTLWVASDAASRTTLSIVSFLHMAPSCQKGLSVGCSHPCRACTAFASQLHNHAAGYSAWVQTRGGMTP